MEFEKTKIIRTIKNNFWSNVFWETNIEGVFLAEITQPRKGNEGVTVKIVFNDKDTIRYIEDTGYLISNGVSVFIRSKTQSQKRESLLVLLAKKKYPDYPKEIKRVYLINEHHEYFDFRLENITITAKETARYESEILPVLSKIGKMRNEIAVKKGYFKERMSAAYSKNLRNAAISVSKEISSFSEEDISNIRKLAETESQSFLAAKYNTARTTIADIINYRIWNEHAFEPSDLDELADETYSNMHLELLEYDEKTHEFLLQNQVEDVVYSFDDDYLYLLKKKVSDQICLFKFDKEGNYLADSHIRFIKVRAEYSFKIFDLVGDECAKPFRAYFFAYQTYVCYTKPTKQIWKGGV